MPLHHIPAESLPREKLLKQGAQALSDAELLALLLRTGIQGKNVLQLASEILQPSAARPQGGFAALLQCSAKELAQIKGLGPAKRAEILAVLEMARRAYGQSLQAQTVFAEPQQLQAYLQLHLGHKPYEVFAVVFLDAQHKLIALEELFRGTLDQSRVYPREVVTQALQHHASAVVLAHNHPSGDSHASTADVHMTKQLAAALALVDVRVLDHIIVTAHGSYSMAAEGLLS